MYRIDRPHNPFTTRKYIRSSARGAALLAMGLLSASSGCSEDDAEDDTPGAQEPAMTEIRTDESNLVMVNVWTPAGQATVADVAAAVTDGIATDISQQPGFIVAGIHQSTDESNVLVYGNWTEQAALDQAQTAIANGEAPTFAAAFDLATSEAHPYRVAAVIEPAGASALTVTEGSSVLTMVNTWTPRDGATVDEVATALVAGLNADISQLPGYLGAGVLASLDGSNVLVYGQWADQTAFDGVITAVQNGDTPVFAQAFALADSTPHPYTVDAVIAAE
ncbi:MAG: antibiotic biosynthesis monooxygenase [Myxococcota bacterium]